MCALTVEDDQSILEYPLFNYRLERFCIAQMMGEKGLFVAFAEDIWSLASVRRVLWLQRHAYQLTNADLSLAVIVKNDAQQLHGFQMSIPRPITFPILNDAQGRLFEAYGVENDKGAFIKLGKDGAIARAWKNPNALPRITDIL